MMKRSSSLLVAIGVVALFLLLDSTASAQSTKGRNSDRPYYKGHSVGMGISVMPIIYDGIDVGPEINYRYGFDRRGRIEATLVPIFSIIDDPNAKIPIQVTWFGDVNYHFTFPLGAAKKWLLYPFVGTSAALVYYDTKPSDPREELNEWLPRLGLSGGVGVSYGFNRHWSIDAKTQLRLFLNEVGLSPLVFGTIGVSYHF